MQNKDLPTIHTDLQSLFLLLQRIESGKLRIPTFQREFVWGPKQVRELLKSVYKGYPIGSLLFMRTSNRSLKANLKTTPFPSMQVVYPTTFVIDGMQRLSTLYGTLKSEQGRIPGNLFAVAFDLKDEGFYHFKEKDLKPWRIPLYSFLDYDEFSAVQLSLPRLNNEGLVKRFMYFYNVIQRYHIPVVTIEEPDMDDVIDIFVRINRHGSRLAKRDLDLALEWMKGKR